MENVRTNFVCLCFLLVFDTGASTRQTGGQTDGRANRIMRPIGWQHDNSKTTQSTRETTATKIWRNSPEDHPALKDVNPGGPRGMGPQYFARGPIH